MTKAAGMKAAGTERAGGGSRSATRMAVARPSPPLRGAIVVPGDKSISHRALMLGALALGETRITGLLEGEDVLATAAALRALGAEVTRTGAGAWVVRGAGSLAEPADVIDLGNSGTGARLLTGLLAAIPGTTVLTGDASLRGRPMERVTVPLARMGVKFAGRGGMRLPMAVTGTDALMPIAYELPVPSAQVKSAILLAGLAAPGRTAVIERAATRDHTERMLRHFGATLIRERENAGGWRISVEGEAELTGQPVAVPADPSSAAFPAVAALIVAGSHIRIPGLGANPLRLGLYETLREMGAEIAWTNQRMAAGEPVADLSVTAGPLTGVDVPASRAPTMIDEYPILAVAAAFAKGATVMRGLAELRVKESDRLAATADALAACGVAVEAGEDTLVVHGSGGPPAGGALVATNLDHRIAMSALVLGIGAKSPVRIDDAAPIETSFPGFAERMRALGAAIEDAGPEPAA